MVIQFIRVGLFFEQGGLIVRLERGLNVLGFVDEVQYERFRFAGARAVEAAEGLDRLNAIQLFVHVHGMEQRLIKAGLIFVRHHQDAIVRGLEGVFDGYARQQAVQAVLGVFLACLGIGDFAGERHQRLEGQLLLFHHFAESKIKLDGVQARAGDHHRPALALDGVQGLLQKVIEHDAGLLLDGVRRQVHVGGEQADGFLLFVFVVGGDRSRCCSASMASSSS